MLQPTEPHQPRPSVHCLPTRLKLVLHHYCPNSPSPCLVPSESHRHCTWSPGTPFLNTLPTDCHKPPVAGISSYLTGSVFSLLSSLLSCTSSFLLSDILHDISNILYLFLLLSHYTLLNPMAQSYVYNKYFRTSTSGPNPSFGFQIHTFNSPGNI